jgi:2-polyprenyl-3-methyl-5-hydroxy-6-metoxy-1,4-benzoquinol methylase
MSKFTINKVNKIYSDKTYLSNNSDWHSSDSKWKTNHINYILKKNNIYPLSVVDIGCGSGDIIYNLSLLYKKTLFHGFDVSIDAYKIAKKKTNKRIKFKILDLKSINYKYECLLCIDVFEHVENYLYFLKSIKNKAKYKVFHIPLDMNVIGLLKTDIIIWARKYLGHLHYFNKKTALSTLEYCKYRIIDSYITTPIFISNPNTFKQYLLKYLAKTVALFSKNYAAKLFPGFSLIVLAK